MPSEDLSRLRKKRYLRNWISQHRLSVEDLILPYFVVEGVGRKEEISSMPGVYRFSSDKLIDDLKGVPEIKAVLLFGMTEKKDDRASEAYKQTGAVQNAVRAIKEHYPHLVVITDVCLCSYISHGHCMVMKQHRTDKEATLKVLARIALSHAESGADVVAPSAMMDGQVRKIRSALDGNSQNEVGILAYAAKYASNFYGPFREALDSGPSFGDRKAYQMDTSNADEALREIFQDIEEGADMVMIKPALSYMDIIHRARKECKLPIVAYNVSGEYAMVKRIGDEKRQKFLAMEILVSLKRAGADRIITYFAKEAVRWLK